MKKLFLIVIFSNCFFHLSSQGPSELEIKKTSGITFWNVDLVEVTNSGLLTQTPFMGVKVDGQHIDSIFEADENYDCLKENNCIDLNGKYMIPGLIDAHIHLTLDLANDTVEIDNCNKVHKILAKYLRAGITTVADLGISPFIEGCLEGQIYSPKVLLSGQLFGPAGVSSCALSYTSCPSTVSEAKKLVKQSYENGRRIVKIRQMEPNSQIRNAIIKKARELEMLVVEHQHDWDERNLIFKNPNNFKPDIFAHTPPKMLPKTKPGAFKPFNYLDTAEMVLDSIAKYNIGLISTLLVERNLKGRQDGVKVLDIAGNFGIDIALGTDSGFGLEHVSSFFAEFDFLAENLGWSDAFKAATINGAKLFKQDKLIGNIEQGKLADFVILHRQNGGNIDISDVCMVIKSGKIVHTSKTCGHN